MIEFETHGPFPIPMHEELKSHELSKLFDIVDSRLNHAPGVYVFLDDNRNGLPVYVGRTNKNSFGGRISSHLNNAKNSKLRAFLEQTEVRTSLLLIAAARNGMLLRKGEAELHHDAIARLEALLIGSCLEVNPSLFNLSIARKITTET